MEKTNKVLRIILSIVTFAAIALFGVGLSILPIESVVAGENITSLTIQELINGFLEQIKNIGEQGGEYAAAHIGELLVIIMVIAFAAVFAIIAVIKAIILLVKTIKGMTCHGTLDSLLKSLVGFGVTLVIYITLLSGTIYFVNPSAQETVMIGMGSYLVLGAGIISLVIAGVYRISVKNETRLVNKILSLVTSAFVIVGVLVAFSLAVNDGEATHGLLWIFPGFIQMMANTTEHDSSVIVAYAFALLGIGCIIVSLGFGAYVIINGFTIEDEYQRPDFLKSSIIKSSVMLGLMSGGFVLIILWLDKVGIGLGIGAIVGMVMGGLALVTSIVNKALDRKPAAPKEEIKAE